MYRDFVWDDPGIGLHSQSVPTVQPDGDCVGRFGGAELRFFARRLAR